MKKLLLIGLLQVPWLLSGMPVDVPQALVGVAQVPVGVAADDPYMLEFMQTVKTDLVQFKDGVLKFYVEPSRVPAFLAMAGAFVCGIGAMGFWADRNQHDHGQLIACGSVVGAAGLAWLAVKIMQQKASDNPPCMVFNNDGIVAPGVAKVAWHDIERFEREKVTVYDQWGRIANRTEVVHFKNKFRMTLLSVSNYYLPIPHDSFMTLVEHYWQCNTGGVIQNGTDVKSELLILPDGNLKRR
jgi:hypothetical protein